MNFISFLPESLSFIFEQISVWGIRPYQLEVCRSFIFSCIVKKHNPLKNKMLLRRTEVGNKKKLKKKKKPQVDTHIMVTLHQYSKVPDNIHSDMGLKLGVYVYTKNPFFKWKQLKKELTKFWFTEIN